MQEPCRVGRCYLSQETWSGIAILNKPGVPFARLGDAWLVEGYKFKKGRAYPIFLLRDGNAIQIASDLASFLDDIANGTGPWLPTDKGIQLDQWDGLERERGGYWDGEPKDWIIYQEIREMRGDVTVSTGPTVTLKQARTLATYIDTLAALPAQELLAAVRARDAWRIETYADVNPGPDFDRVGLDYTQPITHITRRTVVYVPTRRAVRGLAPGAQSLMEADGVPIVMTPPPDDVSFD
ncbi:MAG: hypothetical protein AAGA48_01660 [Myxococcota bacterium]